MATPAPAFTKVALRVPPIDYTSRDFPAISADMVRAIPFFSPEWTDHNLSDFGIVLQRLTAAVADVLHFYVDRIGNEAFLPTAITRRSVGNLLKLIDFDLRSAVPASVDLRFSLQEPLSGDLLIPAGTQVQTTADATEEPVLFETTQDAVIPAGSLEVEPVPAVEGQTASEPVGLSDGLPRQRFPLTAAPVIDGTLQGFIDEGAGEQLWTEVNTFIASEPNSKHFTSTKDEDGRATTFFGDNAQGKIPDPGASIRFVLRTGGGTRGNVPADTITVINSTITFNAAAVALAVTNPEAASGGEDAMSIDQAKVEGPNSLLALNRAVSLRDYEILSEGFPGVAKARAEIVSLFAEGGAACCCGVRLTISPTGGGPPSTQLKADLLAFIESRKMAGTCVEIADPVFRKVNLRGTVTVAPNFDVDSVASDTLGRIDQFFGDASDFVQFGTPIFLSDVFALVDTTPGVDHVDFTEITCQPEVVKELGLAGCEIGGFAIGAAAKEETWTVIFTSPTTFTVRGTVSGFQAVAGTVGAPYTSDKGEVTFTVTCASGAPAAGDRVKFDTCPKFANVPMPPNATPQKGEVDLAFVGGNVPQRECP